MKIKSIYLLLAVIFCVCFPMFSHAQADPPTDPMDVPFDGGLSILLATGVAYGIKKVRDNRKDNKEEKELW